MAQLGYETTLLTHSNPFPEEFKHFLYLSTDLKVSRFSITQIPFKKSQEISKIHEKLELLTSQQMTRRVYSWNLAKLTIDLDRWQDPVPSLHGGHTTAIIRPSPDAEFSLTPSDNLFRPLTPADIRILDFISIKGSMATISQLSQEIQVSRPEVSKRLLEYSNENLFRRIFSFSNIGLDTTVFFFVSTKYTEIPWIQSFLAFPNVYVFYQDTDKPHYYFGLLKIPTKWLKPFARQVDILTQDSGIKFYYKIASSVDFARWGISLEETYQ